MLEFNKFLYSFSLVCALVNIGLFFFGLALEDVNLQLLSLFNVACFLFYFLCWRK
jgi:hypothetical protein